MASVVRLPTDACPRPEGGSAVTIGTYDGVHRGHRTVIGEVHRRAAQRGLASAIVTFDRHPAEVLRPDAVPPQLTELEHEVELLAGTGVDHVVVLTFDEARSKEEPEDFVHDVLVGCLDAKLVIVGDDFHFGHERRGNVALLTSMGRELGFEVEGLDLVGADGSPAEGPDRVSSTAIRRALAAGELAAANDMLGRPHEVRGTVEHGDKRGRELGFPTANLQIPSEIQLPADGIYAGWFERADGSVHATAMSLGHRPTFYERPQGEPLLECNVIDFTGDLYGEAVRVRFVERLRGEVKFDGIDPLIAQMRADVEQTRALLQP
jgi:riboflavin kinase/FMN adenylyltransferase